MGACGGAEQEREPADMVLLGGGVYTLNWADPAGDGTPPAGAPYEAGTGWTPDAEAVAVRDGLIVAVGSEAEVRGYVGSGTRVIDLDGATLLPGLVESHAHAAELGRNLRRVNLVGVANEQELVDRVVAAAADRAAGEWILGWGFDDGEWADRYGDNRMLSERVPDHPVMLSGLHGFSVWLNAAALSRAGIGADAADPPGGRILRRADGSPSGILLDRARLLLAGVVPEETPEQIETNIVTGLQELARSGYVSVHEAGVGTASMAALQRLAEVGGLPIRVYAMLSARDAALGRAWIERGPLLAAGAEDRLTVRSVKAYYDAALGSRGARMLEDYSDQPGHRGTAGSDYGFDEALVTELMRAGFQVGIHAIGDAGNRETLDFLEGVFEQHPETRAGRHRIEHAQVMHPDDLPRLAALGITAAMQPPHAVEDMDWAELRVGPERIRGAYAWRSLREAGTEMAFSSDLPGSDHSVFYGLHAAVTRRDQELEPAAGWHPEEALTAEESLRAYSLWGARAAFQEAETGSIAVGKWADLTVIRPDALSLAADDFGRILQGEVLLTIVGGEVAADPGGLVPDDAR
jgi:predicted amidohydrolase YtcJ